MHVAARVWHASGTSHRTCLPPVLQTPRASGRGPARVCTRPHVDDSCHANPAEDGTCHTCVLQVTARVALTQHVPPPFRTWPQVPQGPAYSPPTAFRGDLPPAELQFWDLRVCYRKLASLDSLLPRLGGLSGGCRSRQSQCRAHPLASFTCERHQSARSDRDLTKGGTRPGVEYAIHHDRPATGKRSINLHMSGQIHVLTGCEHWYVHCCDNPHIEANTNSMTVVFPGRDTSRTACTADACECHRWLRLCWF